MNYVSLMNVFVRACDLGDGPIVGQDTNRPIVWKVYSRRKESKAKEEPVRNVRWAGSWLSVVGKVQANIQEVGIS